jgi:hypothetical protein
MIISSSIIKKRVRTILSEFLKSLSELISRAIAMFYIGSNVLDWPLEAQRGLADGAYTCSGSFPILRNFIACAFRQAMRSASVSLFESSSRMVADVSLADTWSHRYSTSSSPAASVDVVKRLS